MKYYYIDRFNQQAGPVDERDLKSLGVTPETLVWTDGMAQWEPAGKMIPPYLLAGATTYGRAATPPPFATGNSDSRAPIAQCPPTYLAWSILTTILCCIPTGIPAIIYSSRVESLWYEGRHDEARHASAKARTWCIVTACIPVVVTILYLMLFGIGFLGALSTFGLPD
ncbi:MAG: CD225/dispanin family protein [Muribaculaceae bacterium]|nr:CD225/dispanin family protein [Muribaculaceae bacterium]